MNSCTVKEKLYEYFHGCMTPEETERIEQHLEQCDLCKNALSEIQHVVHILRSRQRPEPEEALLQAYHQTLENQFDMSEPSNRVINWINGIRSKWTIIRIRPVRLAYSLALIVLGILADRFILNPNSSDNKLTIEQIQLISFMDTSDIQLIQSYFNETDRFLETIVNLHTETTAIQTQQLVLDAQLLMQKTYQMEPYRSEGDRMLVDFLNQIELILIELSNVPDSDIRASINGVRNIVIQTRLLIEVKKYQNLFNEIASSSGV